LVYLIIVSLIWAFSFGLIKTNLTSIDPVLVAFIRLFISLVIFLPLLRLKNLKLKNVISLILTGGLQYGIMYISYISAYQYLKAFEIALLTVFTPIYIFAVDSILSKRFNKLYLIASLGAIIGTGIVLYKDISSENFILGILLVQISNLAFAAGQILYRKILSNLGEVNDKNIFAFLYFGAVLATLIYLPFRIDLTEIQITSEQFFVLLYLGILPSGIGFFLWNYGARKVNAGALSVLNNFKIPLAVFVSVLFFGETTNLILLFIGLFVVSGSLYITEKFADKSETM